MPDYSIKATQSVAFITIFNIILTINWLINSLIVNQANIEIIIQTGFGFRTIP